MALFGDVNVGKRSNFFSTSGGKMLAGLKGSRGTGPVSGAKRVKEGSLHDHWVIIESSLLSRPKFTHPRSHGCTGRPLSQPTAAIRKGHSRRLTSLAGLYGNPRNPMGGGWGTPTPKGLNDQASGKLSSAR